MMNKRLMVVTLLLAGLMILASITTVIGVAETEPDFNTIVEPGSMVETADYMIFQDDAGNIFAKNGTTGAIDFADSDASTVIQAALDNLPAEGGKVVVGRGIYNIVTTLDLPDYTVFEGMGKDETYFGSDTVDSPMIQVVTSTCSDVGRVEIRNFESSGYGTDAPIIYIEGGIHHLVENLYLHSAGSGYPHTDAHAIHFHAVLESEIRHCDLGWNGDNAIRFTTKSGDGYCPCNANIISDTRVRGGYDDPGIYIEGAATSVTITDCIVEGNAGTGIYLDGGSQMNVIRSTYFDVNGIDVVLNDADDNVIDSCYMHNSDTNIQVITGSQNNKILNTIFRSSTAEPLDLDYSENTLVSGCAFNHEVEVRNSDHAVLDNIRIAETTNHSILVTGGEGVTISNSYLEGTTAASQDLINVQDTSANVTISGNHLTSAKRNAINGDGSSTSAVDNWIGYHEGTAIVGCSYVVGNTIIGSNEGIDAVSDSIISENIIYDGEARDIDAQGVENVSITGNHLTGNARISTATNILFSDNLIDNTGRSTTGLSLELSDGVIVENNIFLNTERGITMYADRYCTVSGNHIQNSQYDGIYFHYGTPDSEHNYITNNMILNSSLASAGTYHGIRIQAHGSLGNITHTYVTGNIIGDAQDSPTQGYGVAEIAPANTSHTVVTDNIFFGNINGGVSVSSNGSVVRDNIGYVHDSEIRVTVSSLLGITNASALWAFQQTTGTTIEDYSPNNHDLTASASVSTWETAPAYWDRTTYYTFNGSDEEMHISDHADFTFGNGTADSSFSVSCVFTISSDASYPMTLIGKYDNTTGTQAREWIVRIDSNGYLETELYDESADAYIGREYQTPLTKGTKYALTVTYNGSETCAGIDIYLDGVEVDDADHTSGSYTAMEDTASDLYIGTNIASGGSGEAWFEGEMSWVWVTDGQLIDVDVWRATQLLWSLMGV